MFFCASDIQPGGRRWPRPGAGPTSGFTLIEIMVALSIFAVLVSVLMGSLSFLLTRTDAMQEDTVLFEEARICLDRMATDLTCVFVPVAPAYKIPDIDDDPDPDRFLCEESRLEFTAFSHLPMGGGIPARTGRIAYSLRKTGEDDQVLMRRDEALQGGDRPDRFSQRDEEKMEPVLCRHVKSFRVACFDEEGREYDAWDSDSGDFSYATPVAVRISLELEGINGILPFETMVVLPVHRKKIAHAL
ncbi:MAG: prepilin-type N-terminal cleavage/methylation domain-containing protein [Thermodesulfobacteriota bacterium]